LFLAAGALAALGVLLILAGLAALARVRPLRFAVRTLTGMLLLALGGMVGAIGIGVQGYHALTREEVVAIISVQPHASPTSPTPQRFAATFRFPDGREAQFELGGDEIYVDAHILKWKPMANYIGLHTSYELDRVGGRYRAIEQERSEPRTLYPLSQPKAVDLFNLRRRYAFLAPLLDAQYGSATFVPVTQPARLELRVSTTGLLVRDAPAPAN
jgi:hypothetical protein